MKGKQLKVYLHPRDHAELTGHVEQHLGCLVLQERAGGPTEFRAEAGETSGSGRLICPSSFVGVLRPRFVPATDEWILSLQSNPMVEWWFSKLAGGALHPGRFCALPASHYSDVFGPEELAEFTSTTARLLSWVRSWTLPVETEWGVERLGPATAELLRRGDLSLRRNPPGSRL